MEFKQHEGSSPGGNFMSYDEHMEAVVLFHIWWSVIETWQVAMESSAVSCLLYYTFTPALVSKEGNYQV